MADTYINNFTNKSLELCNGSLVVSDCLWRIILSCFMTLFMLMSCIGNGAVLLVLRYHHDDIKSASNYFITNLALTDFLLGVLCMPCILISCLNGQWVFGQNLCSLTGFANSFFCINSMITLAAVSVEKYCAIASPLTYHHYMSKSKVTCVISIIWIHSAINASLPFLGWGEYVYLPFETICTVAWWSFPNYVGFIVGINFGLPTVIMSCTYFLVLKIARKHSRRIGVSTSTVAISTYLSPTGTYNNLSPVNVTTSDHQETLPLPCDTDLGILTSNSISQRIRLQYVREMLTSRRIHYKTHIKATLMLLIVIGSFIVCWLPHLISMVYLTIYEISPLPCSFHQITTWLAMANSAFNPIIYGAMDTSIRKGLKTLLGSWVKYCKLY
ncbi:G-protein coupled receptor 161 [Trichoplax sp. H2]|nr:G-protein coupled receptor 161 [Trichoplax sp. H2]|eukprot:RDD38936.1 G-protein coupled receptor 161 [Trichoplax sp. H2]